MHLPVPDEGDLNAQHCRGGFYCTASRSNEKRPASTAGPQKVNRLVLLCVRNCPKPWRGKVQSAERLRESSARDTQRRDLRHS